MHVWCYILFEKFSIWNEIKWYQSGKNSMLLFLCITFLASSPHCTLYTHISRWSIKIIISKFHSIKVLYAYFVFTVIFLQWFHKWSACRTYICTGGRAVLAIHTFPEIHPDLQDFKMYTLKGGEKDEDFLNKSLFYLELCGRHHIFKSKRINKIQL